VLQRRSWPVWVSWRRAETALDRAVEQTGPRSAVLRTEVRAEPAAKRVLAQASHRPGALATSISDGRAAHEAALQRYPAEDGPTSAIRPITSLHNLVEQAPRGGKRLPRPRGGVHAFDAAQAPLVGIERLHRLRKRPLKDGVTQGLTVAEPFDALAA
jgi:transposase-like protein